MPNQTTTYDTDFHLWTQQQALLLRQGLLAELDTAHLIDEIEDMGASNRRALGSYLELVLLHLLKWQFQPERRGNSWVESIGKGRNAIERLLEESPSLTPQLSMKVEAEYRRARRQAAKETSLPLATLPDQCPFTIEQVLDAEYWPD
ncbi:MAG: DUF29 domain-containing protein [Candidatus Competibacteraceae bacterium]